MRDDPRKVLSTGEIVIYGHIFHLLPILILFSSHPPEKLHLFVIKEIFFWEVKRLQQLPAAAVTDRPHSHRHQVGLRIIDARFSIDVLKSLKLPVMDLFVKSALKTHPIRHQLPSAVVSASRQPLALYWQRTSAPTTQDLFYSASYH